MGANCETDFEVPRGGIIEPQTDIFNVTDSATGLRSRRGVVRLGVTDNF
jgi:hypothetical protein